MNLKELTTFKLYEMLDNLDVIETLINQEINSRKNTYPISVSTEKISDKWKKRASEL